MSRTEAVALAALLLAAAAAAPAGRAQDTAAPPPPADAAPTDAAPAGPPAPPPPAWLPREVAELQLLDKVSARTVALSVRVGDSARFGTLAIVVRGCLVRPPDQPADAAAFLDITDQQPGGAGFRGWMFANEPAVALLQHPVYDVRVTGCRA